ncbi:MAG: hypothetical protein AUJ98_07935 [Bacteroidetes bacterium CG2_30_33_31]|nr:MAG: hypothetical protein AUJ98_07935 [Bacteroidetes bacterium CG2_30_33_31]
MKRKILLLSALIVSLGFLVAYKYQEVVNNQKEEIVTDLVVNALNIAHYDRKLMDDNFSREVFEKYLEQLDFSKKFFIKEDVDALIKYRDLIDDELKEHKVDFFELSLKLMSERIVEAESYYKEILSKPFDFDVDESIEVDDKKTNWASNKVELKDAWRKALKYETLIEISNKLDIQEGAKIKNDTLVKQQTFEVIEKEARAKILKRNDDWFRRLHQVEHFDRLSYFMNAIASVYDPHTNYFPPKDKEDFDISISGQLEGIGATLNEKDGYVQVVSIVPGSPSWKQGDLKPNDLIIKVAQGNDEPVDVVGMRLDNAVKLIRGKKGTTVKLTVKNVEGNLVVIPIVRDVVIIEDSYAKSVIVKNSATNKRIGYIYLPQFYVNFNQSNGGRRCSDDVLKEIQKLKKENIDGLVIDLRNNGGGSLPDVVKMAGFFIPFGSIVQVKESNGNSEVLRDIDKEMYYDGPMAVMVNGNSASASEIFAAALQDYGRAVIVGSEMTFGKGTVQRILDLDQIVNNKQSEFKPLGALKITFQKFYRIDGGSTQLKGVSSDIVFPDNMMYIDYGERELENHMQWDKIPPSVYQKMNLVGNLEKIKNTESKIVSKDQEFKMIQDKAKKIKEVRDETLINLKLSNFRAEQKKLKIENDKYSKLMTDTNAVKVIPLRADMQFIEKDSSQLESSKRWYKNLSKDIYLRETINVVNGIIESK